MSQRLVMNYRHSSLGQRFTPSPCQEGQGIAGSLAWRKQPCDSQSQQWDPLCMAASSSRRDVAEGNGKTQNTCQVLERPP